MRRIVPLVFVILLCFATWSYAAFDTGGISNAPYGASWNGDYSHGASKDALYDKLSTMGGTGDLLANGTIPLTADWDVGAFSLTAKSFNGKFEGILGQATPAAMTGTVGVFGSASSLTLGTASSAAGSIILHNATNANHFTLTSGVSGAALQWTLPTAVPGGDNYLLNVDADGTMDYTAPTAFQAADATLTALAGLTLADVSIIEGTGADAVNPVTSAGNNYFLSSNAGNTALEFKTPAATLSAIGAQATDATLTALAGLTIADVSIIEGTGTDAVAMVASGGNNYFLSSNAGNTALEFKTPAATLSAIGAAAASHAHAATDVTSAVFDNARINWAAPGTIGTTTPAAMTGTVATFGGVDSLLTLMAM